MRRSLRFMCATSPSGGPTNPMSVRREHGNLYKPNMHSTTLSEHILTQRATRDEEAWRRKKSTEYKENNMPIGMAGSGGGANVVKKQEKADEEFWDMKSEYYAITATALCGFLTGFLLVGKVLQPEAMRLPYDPVLGFLHDVEVHEARATKVMAAVSESMWGRLKKKETTAAKKVAWF